LTSIVFEQISPTNRLPGAQMEISGSRALSGLPAAQQKLLVVGMRTAAGTVAQLIRKRITSADMAATYFGRGSQLHGMLAATLKANSTTELWAIAQDENAGGTAATKTITLTGPATAAGTVPLMVDGKAIPVAAASGDTATTIATAIAAAINANADLPCTASSAAGVVTVTFRHKGTPGNDLDIRVAHYEGEALPAGLTVAIAAGTTGATNPDLTAVFAAIGDDQYQTMAFGYNDGTNMSAVDTELVSRFGPSRSNDGHGYFGISGSWSTVIAFGSTRNGIHTSLVPTNGMPNAPWNAAAAVAAIAAFYLQLSPSRPLQTLVVPGLIAPRTGRFTDTERNQLLNAGVSTWKVTPGGDVAIERLVTCYQTNAYGFADVTWLDVTTPATVSYLRYTWRARMTTKFPRENLTEDTISAIRAETIALAGDWLKAGLIEDLDGFIATLLLERSATDVTQLNVRMQPNIVNGLLKLAARMEFIL
jgi:phage tail sheath gpL-like